MKRRIPIAAIALVMLAAMSCVVLAQSSPGTGREGLAKALQGAWLPLESGLIASSTEGTPISGKYEIDDGTFQLSVYTLKADTFSGDTFMEVIVDYSTGRIARVEPLTDGGDIAAAQVQKAAIAMAKRSLEAATASVVKASSGYRAVSAMPSLDGGRPVVEVLLLNGSDWKVVTERLD